jgi:UDP-N-acetylmuramoylalanine--D-glutamate ligase
MPVKNCGKLDVAVLLNITPDHLDRYENFEAYAASKMRLFEMGPRAAVLSRSLIRQFHPFATEGPPSSILAPDDFLSDDSRIIGQEDWPALQGPHNAENAAAAMAVCELLEIDSEQVDEGLRTYPGLPHRMERVREKDGVLFVNDSKATNPTATAPALAAFDRIRWICGGQAKTDSLDECAPHFGHVRTAYTMGEAGELFARLLSPHMSVKNCGKLEVAVREAAADAEAGDTVLLSPACASFDQFKDFEDRGGQFRRLVEGL